MEPLLRNTTNASKFERRVHETGADSSVGETVAADDTCGRFSNFGRVTARSKSMI
jgi:hypothetical protein